MLHLFLLGTSDDVVGPLVLVGRDEVGVVDRRHRLHRAQFRGQLPLQIIVENLGAGHSLGNVGRVDVPAANDQVVGLDHGQDRGKGHKDFVPAGVGAQLESRGLGDGSKVVGGLDAALGAPLELGTVCSNGSRHGRSVVSAPADEQQADARYGAFGPKVVDGFCWFDGKTLTASLDERVLVSVARVDGIGSVADVWRLDGESRFGQRGLCGLAIDDVVRWHCKR